MRGTWWKVVGVLLDSLERNLDRRVKLPVFPRHHALRVVVDDDIGIGSVVFDPPFAIGIVEGVVRLLHMTVIDRCLRVEYPYQSAPGGNTHHCSEFSGLKILDERLAVGAVVLI